MTGRKRELGYVWITYKCICGDYHRLRYRLIQSDLFLEHNLKRSGQCTVKKDKICIHQYSKIVYSTPTGMRELTDLLQEYAQEFLTAIPEETTVKLELF